MKNLKTGLAAGITILTVIAGSVTSFAETVSNITKDSSSIEISNGLAEIISQKKTEFKDEHSNSTLVSTQVNVNTQKINSDNGKILLETEQKTSYDNVTVPAIIDIKATVNAPIISGDEDSSDLEIKDTKETNLNNTNAKYVKLYEFNYNKPYYLK